jgi:hypothetical protein
MRPRYHLPPLLAELPHQVVPSGRCGHWHLTVSKCSQLAHPIGHPINHSTHRGFSLPPATQFSGGVFRSACDGPALLLESCFVGVGSILAIVSNPGDFRLRSAAQSDCARAVGVGH